MSRRQQSNERVSRTGVGMEICVLQVIAMFLSTAFPKWLVKKKNCGNILTRNNRLMMFGPTWLVPSFWAEKTKPWFKSWITSVTLLNLRTCSTDGASCSCSLTVVNNVWPQVKLDFASSGFCRFGPFVPSFWIHKLKCFKRWSGETNIIKWNVKVYKDYHKINTEVLMGPKSLKKKLENLLNFDINQEVVQLKM